MYRKIGIRYPHALVQTSQIDATEVFLTAISYKARSLYTVQSKTDLRMWHQCECQQSSAYPLCIRPRHCCTQEEGLLFWIHETSLYTEVASVTGRSVVSPPTQSPPRQSLLNRHYISRKGKVPVWGRIWDDVKGTGHSYFQVSPGSARWTKGCFNDVVSTVRLYKSEWEIMSLEISCCRSKHREN